jgi:hypothetical protein
MLQEQEQEPERVYDQFPTHHMTILLGDFNVKLYTADTSKPIRGMRQHSCFRHSATSRNIAGSIPDVTGLFS